MISGTKSVIGLGEADGKFFLDSVTSVGHSSSEGKPMTLTFGKEEKKRDRDLAFHLSASAGKKTNATRTIETHLMIFPSWSTSDSPQNKGLADTIIATNQKKGAGFVSFSSKKRIIRIKLGLYTNKAVWITQFLPLGGAIVSLEEELRTINTPGVCFFPRYCLQSRFFWFIFFPVK